MKLAQTRSYRTFVEGLWANNPIFRMILGICSSLAVTNNVKNTIAMGVSVICVTTGSSLIVSLIRNLIPRRVRIPVFLLVIATWVIFIDQYLRAYYPVISEQIGPYVGLIITNCIVMGRCESFASGNKPSLSALDGLGVSMGYAFSLLIISIIREILGFGSILGFDLLGKGWNDWVIMVMSPGGFFVLAIYIWVLRTIARPQLTRKM